MWTLAIFPMLALSLGAEPESTADAVTLRSGKVVLGQVITPSPPGKLTMLVRRAWAEVNLPDEAARWQATEAPFLRRSRAERRARLEAWRRERPVEPGRDDRIATWIGREITRLEGEGAPTPLMVVVLNRAEVRSVRRRPEGPARLLRQGWRAGFADVETMPPGDLKAGLEGRGLPVGDVDPAPVDDLLPVPIESDRRWLARRAATELIDDPGLRFLRYQDFVLPEGTPGAAGADAPLAAAALSGLRSLLGDEPASDPLAPRFREAEARGRVGLVVTRLEMAADFSSVGVESVLWVRTGPGHWEPAARRSATARPGEMRPGAGEPLADDPQVKAAFGVFEGLGLLDPDAKRLSLGVGAATRKALHEAQGALTEDLQQAALRVD